MRAIAVAFAFALLVLAPAALYLAGARAVSQADDKPFRAVIAFDPDETPSAALPRQAAAAAMIAGGAIVLFLSPGMLGLIAARRLSRLERTAPAWNLILNSAALLGLLFVLRHTVGIGRAEFLVAWTGWTAVLFAAAWRPGETPAFLANVLLRWTGPLLVGAGFAAAGMTIFFPEQFVQCFNEDGTEAYELARSLKTRALPAWEFETAELDRAPRFGTVIVNPALINSTWTCGLQVLLGEGELSTRLPYWALWLAVFVFCCRLACPAQTSAATLLAVSIPIGLLMFLAAVLFTFYVGYNPYMADLANPGVPNALFTLCVLAAFDCLRGADRWGFVLSMVLASLVLYAGPVFLALTLAAAFLWRPIPRRSVVVWGLTALAVLAAIAAGYLARGAMEGVLPYWIETFDVEYVNDYLATVPRWKSGPLFFGYFVLGAGGLAVWGMFAGLRGEPWQRTLATAAWGYLLIVLCSGYKNLHYIGPLLPIPLVLFLGSAKSKDAWKYSLAAGASLLVCIVLSWPAQRATFVLNRELGAQTTFTTGSYETAAAWARLQDLMRARGVISWDCDRHTWVAYSKLNPDPSEPRPFIVSAGEPPPGYFAVIRRPLEESTNVATLFTREPTRLYWLSSQRPLRPLARYPFVFLPLADGPYSPHNNFLEDVRRLEPTPRSDAEE